MVEETLFHPYKIISQTDSSLDLQAGKSIKIVRLIFLLAPLFLLATGIVLYVVQQEALLLYALGGAAVLELILFSLIQLPGNVQMDRIGFTLQLVSVKGSKQKEYLWSDVDVIRQRIIRSKNGTALSYQAILKNGKSARFLSFPNFLAKKEMLPEMHAVLERISGKSIVDK